MDQQGDLGARRQGVCYKWADITSNSKRSRFLELPMDRYLVL
jgi:hypothetical protein